MSRRAVVAGLGASVVLPAVAGAERARAADRPAAGATDRAAVVTHTVDLLAGTEVSNARAETGPKLTAMASAARSHLAAMERAGDGEMFAQLPLGSSDTNLTTSFQYLYEIALATRAPGAATAGLYGETTVQRRVLDGLSRLYDGYYGDQARGYYGNWFNWEIGISTYVSRTLALLQDLTAAERPDLAPAYVAAMDAYLRNGKDGDVDLDSRFHTGANLADITTNRILQGAVLTDDGRIAKAVSDQLTVLATIDPYDLRHGVTDGFYADGSFLQHASVAYTGSYGTGLLSRVVQTLVILHGTAYTEPDPPLSAVRTWLVDGFAPVLFEGWMMEAVKGRGISRTTTGYADAAVIVEAVVSLTALTTAEDAAPLKGYIQYLARTAKAAPDPAGFVSPVAVARHADILADTSLTPADLGPAARSVAFAAMERTVHRRPGYAFTLSRSSTRISKYEYMNGENLMPWFQGEGAHHLYLAGQDQREAFGADHYATVSPYRLAGVTAPVEDRRTVPELYGTSWYDNPARGFTSSSASQNSYVYFPLATDAFSGGAVLGAYGTAGLVQSSDAAWAAARAGELPGDFVAYRAADATKSWFLFDEEIVVLAAGVGDSAGRAVTTTLDSRVCAPSNAVEVTGQHHDGRPWTGAATPAWLRYHDATNGISVGYVLMDVRRPSATLETVSRSRRLIRTANPDTQARRKVFSLVVQQPAGAPHMTMAYAIVPHASVAGLRSRAGGPVTVLANSPRLQAVRHDRLPLVAANAFTGGTHRAGPLTLDGPASVMLRTGRGGEASLAVCDPTTRRDTVSVLLHGRARRAAHADDGVRVRPVFGGTLVEAATRHLYGRSLTVVLR